MKRILYLLIFILLVSISCSLPSSISINAPVQGGVEPTLNLNERKPKDNNKAESPSVPADEIDFSARFGIGGYIYPDIQAGPEPIYATTRELDKLGMVWLRHPGRGISWYEIQPARDSWDFAKLDAVTTNNAHPWLLPIYGMIGNVYPFGENFSVGILHSLEGKDKVMETIITNSVNMDDPQQRQDAEIYVKTLVNRYKDTVKYWEIGGNEGIGSPERFGIVKYTYQWIKEADPTAFVILTANCGDYDEKFYEGITSLNNLLSQGAGEYFDIANMHYYGQVEGNFEEKLETRFDEFKTILNQHGIDKPIWVTETSTSSQETSFLSGQSSEQLQAQHVIKRMVVFSSKGAEKVFWYDYGEVNEDDMFYGCNLVDNEDGFKPAYYTFQLLFEKLGTYRTVNSLRDDHIHLYAFTNPDGALVYVGWSDTKQQVNLKNFINAPKVVITHIVEVRGQNKPQIEQAPTEKVPLSPSPVFITLEE